jgi:chemotaxis protein CheD
MLSESTQVESAILYVEPGQLLVSTEPHVLRTILGSCVSVCLYDPLLRQGGMNHFMLPSARSAEERSFRYGDRSLLAMVERLERLGSSRHKLCASVFGGARMLSGVSETLHLGRRNAEFALDWLYEHRIQVIASGLLGDLARRLDFDLSSGSCSARPLGDC